MPNSLAGERSLSTGPTGVLDTRYVICEDCGESNKAGAQFCLFCGAYLEWQDSDAEEANEVTQQLPPVTRTSVPPAAPPPASTPAPVAAAAPAARPAPPPTPTPTQSTQPSQPVHQPTPVDLTPDEPVVSMAGAAQGCPRCGRPIDPKRRFCAHCGEQFIKPGGDAPVTRPTQKRDTWWSRLWDSKDRVARRAYRRSLPPLYRWRRVIIAILTLALIGGGLGACHGLDLPFVFGATRGGLLRVGLAADRGASRLADAMQDAWVAFARTGEPAADALPDWPAYETHRRYTMTLGGRRGVVKDPHEAARAFWSAFIPNGEVGVG